MATYVNDLRLKEIATGDESGTWGASTNTNLELIAEAFSYGTEASFGSDADATTTIADGATDPARSLYFKVTSGVSLTATRTLTLAPNDVSKVWIIENATSGSQSINISQGSGSNVTIGNGDVKIVYSDGGGASANVVDAFTDLSVTDKFKIEGSTPTLTIGDGGEEDTKLVFDGNAKDFYVGLDDSADKLVIGEGSTVGTNSIVTLTDDSVTIGDGAEVDTKIVFDGNAQDFYIGLDDSADDLIIGSGSAVGTTPAITIDENQDVTITQDLTVSSNTGLGSTHDLGANTHIKTADSGVSAVNGNADDLVIENADFTGISILGENETSIFFGDNEDSDVGRIEYAHSTNVMKFRTNASDSMIIDSSGNVGIGTSSPSQKLSVTSADNTSSTNIARFAANNDSLAIGIGYETIRQTETGGVIKFETNGSEAMRVNDNQQLGINSTISNVQGKIFIDHTGADTDNWGLRFLSTSSSNPAYIVDFIDYQGQRMGSIQGNSSSNTITYGTSSDYRLKENVSYDWDATTRLKQLKPARFNWIRDESNTLVDGFLAHEVEDIVPEAISGEKDATETYSNVVLNSYGNLIDKNITESEWEAGKEDDTYDEDTTWAASHTQNLYQSIDQSKLVPLLVKTIQELEARITTLENA